jgi:hypothetical protein
MNGVCFAGRGRGAKNSFSSFKKPKKMAQAMSTDEFFGSYLQRADLQDNFNQENIDQAVNLNQGIDTIVSLDELAPWQGVLTLW